MIVTRLGSRAADSTHMTHVGTAKWTYGCGVAPPTMLTAALAQEISFAFTMDRTGDLAKTLMCKVFTPMGVPTVERLRLVHKHDLCEKLRNASLDPGEWMKTIKEAIFSLEEDFNFSLRSSLVSESSCSNISSRCGSATGYANKRGEHSATELVGSLSSWNKWFFPEPAISTIRDILQMPEPNMTELHNILFKLHLVLCESLYLDTNQKTRWATLIVGMRPELMTVSEMGKSMIYAFGNRRLGRSIDNGLKFNGLDVIDYIIELNETGYLASKIHTDDEEPRLVNFKLEDLTTQERMRMCIPSEGKIDKAGGATHALRARYVMHTLRAHRSLFSPQACLCRSFLRRQQSLFLLAMSHQCRRIRRPYLMDPVPPMVRR